MFGSPQELRGGRERAVLEGHTDMVWSVAFAPDGSSVASGSEDETVRVWDLASGAGQFVFRGHPGGANAVAFGPGGRVLASAGEDGTARLWDLTCGKERVVLRGMQGGINAVALAPDGRTLAAGGGDFDAPGAVDVWDRGSYRKRATLWGHTNEVLALAYSPCGRLLATGGFEGSVQLWEVRTGQIHGSLPGHRGAVWAVAFAPDGRTLATGGDDGTVRLWDVKTGQERSSFRGPTFGVLALAYSPDGKALASGHFDGTVRLWDPARGREQSAFRGHVEAVLSVAFAPDGRSLASGGMDATVRLWQLPRSPEWPPRPGRPDRISPGRRVPPPDWCASGPKDGPSPPPRDCHPHRNPCPLPAGGAWAPSAGRWMRFSLPDGPPPPRGVGNEPRGVGSDIAPHSPRPHPPLGPPAAGATTPWEGPSMDPQSLRSAASDSPPHRALDEGGDFLARVNDLCTSAGDCDTLLSAVARLAVPRLADWCAVDLLDGDRIRRAALAHADPASEELLRSLFRETSLDPGGDHPVARALRTGRPLLALEAPEVLKAAGAGGDNDRILSPLRPDCCLIVPLRARGRTFGSLLLAAAGRSYGPADVEAAGDFALRAALALEGARLEQRGREAEHRGKEMLAVLAHELRNPIGALRNALAALRLPGLTPAARAAAEEIMERQLRHLTHLVEDLLDASRLDRGKLELRRERLDLAAFLRTAAEDHRGVLEAAGLRLELDLPTLPVWVQADPTRLAQVLGNLLSNAAKFTDPGGRVLVRLTREADGRRAVVSVRDTGIGVEREMLPHLFDGLVEAGAGRERGPRGLGLGLSLVRALVELHGGRACAQSEGAGRGTEIAIWLPGEPDADGAAAGDPER